MDRSITRALVVAFVTIAVFSNSTFSPEVITAVAAIEPASEAFAIYVVFVVAAALCAKC